MKKNKCGLYAVGYRIPIVTVEVNNVKELGFES